MAVHDPIRSRRKLAKRLKRLAGQAIVSTFARRLHGNALLLLGGLVAVLALLHGLHLLGLAVGGPGRLLAASILAGLVLLSAAEAAVEAYLRRPGREGVARRLDATLMLEDRVAAAWWCLDSRRDDAIADALVLRATERTVALEPSAVYPIRHQRYVWYLLLAAIVLIVILPYGVPFGLLPLVPGRAEVGPLRTNPSGSDSGSQPAIENPGEDDPGEKDPAPADEPAPDAGPPRALETELYAELPSYPAKGPVPMTVRLRAREPDPRPVDGRLVVRVDDGPWVPLPGSVEVAGGREYDRLRSFDLRQALQGEGSLGSGTHRVQAAFERTDGPEPDLSEEVEIFVEPSESEDEGGGGEQPPPEPPPDEPPPEPPPPTPPAPEEPPPPEPPPGLPDVPAPTLLVKPLFDEGETVRKVGPALVFDPAAPRGDPPRERPLEETFPELRRRAEDAVSRDEVPPEWRRLVLRYFDLIRPR